MCCKIVSKAEKKRRLERDNERRQQKRPNESTAEKEERLKKEPERIRKRKENQTEGEDFEKGLESVSDAERKKLARYKANAERRRQKLANESAAEKEERLKKQRERKRSQRAQESQQLSEEEKKEHLRERKQAEFFRWEAKKASMTPEEIEQAEFQRKMKTYMRNVARKASLTPEERNRMEEARRQRQKGYFANLPEEKRKGVREKMRAYWQNLPVETKREKSRTAMETYHKKLRETNPAKLKELRDKFKEYMRRKIATETPEQRHKRLLKDKVKQAKRRARMKMEAEGISPEEIERRLEEVVRGVEEKDRLERERNPVDPADYKPRENARKPRKRTCATVTAPQPSELESEAVVRPRMLPFHSSSPLTGASISDSCLPTPAPEQPSYFEAVSSTNVEELKEARVEDVNIQEVSETIPEVSSQDDDDEPVEADYFSERSQSPTYSHSPPVSPLDHSEDTHHLITERVSQAEAPTQDKICEDDSEPNPISDPQNPVAEAAIPHYDSAASMNGPTEQDLPTTIRKEQIREKESPPSTLPSSSSSSPLPTAIENEKVDEVDRIKCDECGKMLRLVAFKFHKFTFHNPNRADYKCPKCDRKFITAATLWDHYLNFHEETLTSEQGESSFVKLKRGRSSSTVPNEKQQEKKNPNNSKIGPFICEQCGNKYTQKAQMDAHVRRVHFDQRFICDVCGKEEQTGGKLWKHKVANHPEIETPAPEGMVVCEYCSEPVLRSYQFHVKKYHPEKYDEFEKKRPILKVKKVYRYKRKKVLLRTKCPECDQEIRADIIKRHLRNVHGHGTNSFPCRQCNKVFKENYNLNVHIRRIHTLNSFDRKVEEMELIKEKKDEDGELFYSCSVCDERLLQRKDMNNHLRVSHFDLYEQLKQPGDDAELEERRVVPKRRTPAAPSQNNLKKPENNQHVNCDECGKSLHTKALNRHKHLFHNQSSESNKCPKCEVCFTSPKTLWNHYHFICSIEETVASLEELESRRLLEGVKFGKPKAPIGKEEDEKGFRDGLFECEHCGNEYTQKGTRDAHVRKIHLNQRFICDICDKEEPTGGKLWKHKIANHPEIETPAPEGMVVCEYCSKPVLRNYQQHVEKFHPEKLAEFKKKGSYIQTTKGHNGRSRSKCPECGKEVRYLRHHIKIVHGHGWELRPCQHCQKEFKTNSELNEHIRTRHTFESFERKVEAMKLIKQTPTDKGQPSLSCSLCDANLFSRKDMGAHLLSAHFNVYEQLKKTEYEDLWKCGECSEAFDTEQLFSSHVQRSHPSTTFYCSQLGCYKLFASQLFLQDHCRKQHPHIKGRNPLLNVDVERPVPLPGFQCSRCDAKFLQKPKLVEHVRSEHPGNYWPCQHCDLFGYREQVLKNHLPKCNKNPDKKVLVIKFEKNAKKKCSKTKISQKKRLREESETEEETESDDDDDRKRSRSPMEMGTRRSSRIKIKQDKKRGKKLKAKVAQGSLNDDKLNMEMKVRVERLTKEQIDFYIATKYP